MYIRNEFILIINFQFKRSTIVRILVPVSCWEFNPTFTGNPGLTFSAGIHCICLSIPVFMLLCHKSFTACRLTR